MDKTLLGGGFFAGSCFYSGQTGEVALKAFLYSRGHRHELVHSIQELSGQELSGLCARYDLDFGQFSAFGLNMDRFYLETRYPDALAKPEVPFRLYTRQETEQALRQAKHILEFAQERIPQVK